MKATNIISLSVPSREQALLEVAKISSSHRNTQLRVFDDMKKDVSQPVYVMLVGRDNYVLYKIVVNRTTDAQEVVEPATVLEGTENDSQSTPVSGTQRDQQG